MTNQTQKMLEVSLRTSMRITIKTSHVPADLVAGVEDKDIFKNIEDAVFAALEEAFPLYDITISAGEQRLRRDY